MQCSTVCSTDHGLYWLGIREGAVCLDSHGSRGCCHWLGGIGRPFLLWLQRAAGCWLLQRLLTAAETAVSHCCNGCDVRQWRQTVVCQRSMPVCSPKLNWIKVIHRGILHGQYLGQLTAIILTLSQASGGMLDTVTVTITSAWNCVTASTNSLAKVAINQRLFKSWTKMCKKPITNQRTILRSHNTQQFTFSSCPIFYLLSQWRWWQDQEN